MELIIFIFQKKIKDIRKRDNKNTNGKKYYEDAMEFSEWVKSNLEDLSSNDAVDASGNSYNSDNYRDNNPFVAGRKIFSELKNGWRSSKCIEDTDSEFNAHRIEVIKNSIESNLIVAISNYNKVSSSGVNFQMPKLTDIDWEELTTNVSMITFLQGLNIGGKIYSGYSIVRNDITEDFVSEDSIYICYTNTATYYKVTDTTLTDQNEIDPSSTIGIFNVDFERKTAQVSDKEQEKNIYYYPRSDMASYKSIIKCVSYRIKFVFSILSGCSYSLFLFSPSGNVTTPNRIIRITLRTVCISRWVSPM